MEQIVEAVPLPALVIDAQERIVCANSAARQLLGEAIKGRHFITALRQPRLLDAVEAVLRDSQPRETQYLGNDGEHDTTFRATVRPVPLEQSHGVMITFQDVSHLEQAGQMRRDFVANVSHELRTPLTAIMGFIETLKTHARDDAAARDRFLTIMEGEAGRMNRLVGDLLSLSRVEQDERVRPQEFVFLPELVASVAKGMEMLAQKHEASIALDLPAESFSIPADADQIRQVLNNLIENAIKYGGKGVSVRVGLSAPSFHSGLRNNAVVLTVSDTGPGIDARHLPRLTERFYRIDSHRSREMGGTGLGLAIVKHIINRHRGRMRVESTVGEGTTFTVILPAD